MQSLEGEKATYKTKFLNTDLEEAIETLDKNQIITFSTTKELILKLILNNNAQELCIFEKEKINTNKTHELSKKLFNIHSNTIKQSIKYNKTPACNTAKTVFEEYYLSKYSRLDEIIKSYKEYPSKKNLLNEAHKIADKLNEAFRFYNYKPGELYFVSISLLNLIQILKEYEPQNAQQIEEEFYSYFKNFNNQTKANQINTGTEKLVEHSILANKLSKNNKTHIIPKKHIPQEISLPSTILKTEPVFELHLKPNKRKIKQIFKYSYNEIAKTIGKLPPAELEKQQPIITVKNKKIRIYPQLYTIQKIYQNYKIKAQNEYFTLLEQN